MPQHKAVLAFAAVLAFGGGQAQAAGYRVVHSFQGGSDGAVPLAGLVNVGGTLYGTTGAGGGTQGGEGTVFAVAPSSGAETVVYSFQGSACGEGPEASLIDVAGMLYGTTPGSGTNGTVFALDVSNGVEQCVAAGPQGQPQAALINVGGTLYGTTTAGGGEGNGFVYSVDLKTAVVKTVYTFQGGNDGDYPLSALINIGGTLYGTTVNGGAFPSCDCGTVFSLDPAKGAEKVLYSFQGGSDGGNPLAGLIDVGGILYGTTSSGGLGYGTVFSLDPTTGAESVVYAFQGGRDGNFPAATVVKVGGLLYGTTMGGGTYVEGKCDSTVGSGCGTVFSVSLKTGAERVLHSFGGNRDGYIPRAPLLDINGTLYGTTEYGGAGNSATCSNMCGTVFALKP